MKVKEAREMIRDYKAIQKNAKALMHWCLEDRESMLIEIEEESDMSTTLRIFLGAVISMAETDIARIERIIDDTEVEVY